MPQNYTLKLSHDLKKFFEAYIKENLDLGFNNVAEYLRNLIINHKNDLEMDLYNLTVNKKIIEVFNIYAKDNPDLGYISGDEYLRECIREKAEEVKK